MNHQDQEAFEKWWKSIPMQFVGGSSFMDFARNGFKAALEYERGVEDRRYHDGLQDGITKEREKISRILKRVQGIYEATSVYESSDQACRVIAMECRDLLKDYGIKVC